ncbi:Sec7 domain-containing protein [Rhodotorula paludigena]|uniref:Sec7 domain-containing protein n=1 Tax=Rhodotorula paludigena TaxID=86838 RepID=UPI0031816B16
MAAVPDIAVLRPSDGADDAPAFSVEVPAANVIHAEILAVTSAMRKNQRWASAAFAAYPYLSGSSRLNGSEGVGGSGVSPANSLFKGKDAEQRGGRNAQALGLMGGFAELKMRLRDLDGPEHLDAVALLHPFLEVIRSPETSGPITATALSSIDKFITYSILSPSSPNLAAAMSQLSSAGTHCKFEASDSVSDEVVLLKILDVLRNCLTGRLGQVLSDESVCEMMETGLSMCCQMRLSEMLRRSAERTMQAMVAAVFSRLRHVPSEDELGARQSQAMASSVSLSEVAADVSAPGGPRMAAPDPRSAQIPAAGPSEVEDRNGGVPVREVEEDLQDDGDTDDDGDIAPFGLASIQELLRVLISLLNPHDQQHTDTMRLMALGLLNIAFEVGGRSIGRFPVLRMMVADHLCKHLFQLARSDHPQLLSTSLRVITNIFDTMRPHLKLQQELFLSFLLDRLILPNTSAPAVGARKADVESQLDLSTWAHDSVPPSAAASSSAAGGQAGDARPSTPLSASARERSESTRGGPSAESRELMLEILGHFARGKYSMVDLWVNYDCNVEGEDLFERLVKFLSRGVYPAGGSAMSYVQDTTQLMCLDTILELVADMAVRLHEPSDDTLQPSQADEVARSKANKRLLLEGAAAFNRKPKVGLQFLEEHGIIYSDPKVPRPESLARFLKTTPRLDKRLLGDFISRPDMVDVLQSFMHLMEFEGKMICDALRELLEAFRLPGESQQINRIAETFAEVYFATKPPEIKSQDATYVLTYSVIMLNTDAHSPQVRKRMDFEAYSRNLRGVNDGENFDPEYLRAIFESIRKREIVLPEEHHNQVGFEYGWKELLRRSRRTGPFTHHRTNMFDRGMFAIAWKPLVSAMSFAFANFRDDYMVQRAIGGFNHCAALAARFGMPEVFDYLILSLSRVSGLVQTPAASQEVGNFPVVDVEGQKVTVSPVAVRFGMNVKAQLAAVVLFTIANNNGAFIRQGWQQVFEIYQTLFTHSLLPPSMLMMEDFLSGTSAIPLKPKAVVTPREERRGDGGLLSTLSSYLLSPYGAGSEMAGTDFTDDDIETTLSAVDCVASCRVEELYSQIFDLKGEALVHPVQILVDLVQRITIDRVRTRSGSGSAPNSPQISITPSRVQLPYDPSAVLLLEIVTSIVARSQESLGDLWPISFDFLSRLLASANSFSSLFNERVVASLLRLVAEVIKSDELRDSCFLALDMLRSLSPAVLSSVAEPLMAGLSRVFTENASRVYSTTEWNLLFALFSATAQQEEAAKISMDLLRQLASGQLGVRLQADNYAAFLQTLAGFAHFQPSKQASDASDDAALVRGLQIVDVLREVQAAIPNFISTSTLSPARAWEAAWIPLLSAYAQLCLNPARELRQNAITSLQRTLLAPEILQNTDVDLTIIFERVFFPLLEELLKPQVFRRDPEGMGETRLRASALLCKVFLQYLTQLSERQGMQTMTELWLKILGYQDRFMHSGRRDQMFEAVPELLKNVLLVMNASNFLVPPHEPSRTDEQARLWDATFERIQPFLPELQRELFPPPRVPVPFSASTAASPAQPSAFQPPAPAAPSQQPPVASAPQQVASASELFGGSAGYAPPVPPVQNVPQPQQEPARREDEQVQQVETPGLAQTTVDLFGP